MLKLLILSILLVIGINCKKINLALIRKPDPEYTRALCWDKKGFLYQSSKCADTLILWTTVVYNYGQDTNCAKIETISSLKSSLPGAVTPAPTITCKNADGSVKGTYPCFGAQQCRLVYAGLDELCYKIETSWLIYDLILNI